MLLWKWDPKFQKTDISRCHQVPSRNLKQLEGRHIIVKFVRRQTKSGLKANKKPLEDCEEKFYQR